MKMKWKMLNIYKNIVNQINIIAFSIEHSSPRITNLYIILIIKNSINIVSANHMGC